MLNVPHGQNTQSDRMFISFDPHPLWMCHHLASSLRRCPTQVHGVMCFQPQASRMRLCAVCPPRVAWMQQQNTQSDRGSFTPARRCASYVLRCLVPTSFAGAQRIILLSGSASFFSVVRPSLVRAAHTRGGAMSVTWFSAARHNHRVWLTPSDP